MYSYAADASVVELLLSSGRRDRDALMRCFASLSENPFQPGEFQVRDSAGRPLEVMRSGWWLVTYWADHGAKEVRIVALARVTP